MGMVLGVVEAIAKTDPPAGGMSPLAWTIILALCAFIGVLLRALQVVYNDLKESRKILAERDENALGMFRVISAQMERSKGGGSQ